MPTTTLRVRARLVVLTIALGAMLATGGVAAGSQPSALSSWTTAGSQSGCPSSACATVLSDVAQGTHVKKVPGKLTPSLEGTSTDILFPPTMPGCGLGLTGYKQPSCTDGSTKAAARIALIGDSEAQTWSIGLDVAARRDGYSIMSLAKSECPVAEVSIQLPYDNSPYPSCAQFLSYAIKRINSFDPSIVVVSTLAMQFKNLKGRDISASKYTSAVVSAIDELKAPGRKIYVLGDPPHQNVSPPICLAAHESDVAACTESPKAAFSSYGTWQDALRSAALKAGANYVNVVPWFCTSKSCPLVVNDIEVYLDYGHMTSTYGVFLSSVLASALHLSARCSPSTSCNTYQPFEKASYYTSAEMTALAGATRS